MLHARAAARTSFAWSRKAWQELDHRNRHWLTNVMLGVGIEVVLMLARNLPAVVAVQNWVLDAAMQASAEMHATNVNAMPAMVVIDIDEATWRDPDWGGGEPIRAPRDGLSKLIEYAIEQDARYIVLDVIVDGTQDAEDKKFARSIERYVAATNDGAVHLKPDQHILFVRTLRQPLGGMEELLAPEIRPSALDQVLADHPDQLHAVAPYFRVSRDGILRDWQMWQTACRRDTGTDVGHWETLPSVQLVIGALHVSQELPGQGIISADRTPFPWRKPASTGLCPLALDAVSRLGVPASKLRPDDAAVWEWIRNESRLKNPSELDPSGDEAVALTDRIFFQFVYRQEFPVVRLVPAVAIIRDIAPRHLAQNSVVIIGQSFEAARDQHMTPLGVMPGSMVLANSVNSILSFGFLHEPREEVKYGIVVCLIVLVGWLFAYLDYLIIVTTTVLFIAGLLPLNYYLARYHGIWIDFAVPLLGIAVHWAYVEIETYPSRRRARVGAHTEREGEN